MNNYIVYVKTDSSGRITAINSSAFLSETDGWVQIDSGVGDKYHHAQGNYPAAAAYDGTRRVPLQISKGQAYRTQRGRAGSRYRCAAACA